MTKSKKKIIYVLLFLIIFLLINCLINNTMCDKNNLGEIETNLFSNINGLINNIDFSNIDEILNKNTVSLIPNFKESVMKLLKGEYFTDFLGILKLFVNIISDCVKKIMPSIFIIIAITILCNISNSISNDSNKDIHRIINIINVFLVILIVLLNVKDVIVLTNKSLETIKLQMDVLFPILLTLLVSIGGVVSASIYNPTIAILSNAISSIFNYFLYPIFIISFIFTILTHINKNIKLNKINNFLSSLFKWSIGIIFTVFSAILSIQGISAGKFDGVSIKTAKFAVKSYIPIIGGYLSEGLDFIVLSSILIKNAIGVVGLMILIFTIISPIFKIIVFKLSLQFLSGVLESVGDGQVSLLLEDLSKVLLYPIIIILAISFMYILMLALLILSANII